MSKTLKKIQNYTTFRQFWLFFTKIAYFRPRTAYCIVFLTLSWNTRTCLVLDDARRSRLILISPNDFYIDPVQATYFLILPIKLHFLRNLYNMKLINHFQFCLGSLKATGRDITWRRLWQIGQDCCFPIPQRNRPKSFNCQNQYKNSATFQKTISCFDDVI